MADPVPITQNRKREGDMTKLTYLSICSGIEAASVAWECYGWECLGVSEIEKFPSQVLKHHYPNVPNFGDFTKITKEMLNGKTVDILVGGTPCQDYSVAGKRAGMAGERGNLTLEFVRLIERIQPRYFVWENVPGVLSSNGGRDFSCFLGDLAKCGYGFAYRILDVQFVRVQHGFSRAIPQRRRRVFVVGCAGDWRRAAAILFERESLSGHTPPGRKTREETAGIAGKGTSFRMQSFGEYEQGGGSSTVKSRDYKDATDLVTDWHKGVHPCLSQSLKSSGGIGMSNQELFSQKGAGGNNQPAVCFENHAHDSRITGPNEVVSTVNSRWGTGGNNQDLVMAFAQTSYIRNNSIVRRLTPVECERLMGFPDGWTDIKPKDKLTPDGCRYKALGNSMGVNVMRWIGSRIQLAKEAL